MQSNDNTLPVSSTIEELTSNEVLAMTLTPSGNSNENAKKLQNMNFNDDQISEGESTSDLLVESQSILIYITAL